MSVVVDLTTPHPVVIVQGVALRVELAGPDAAQTVLGHRADTAVVSRSAGMVKVPQWGLAKSNDMPKLVSHHIPQAFSGSCPMPRGTTAEVPPPG